MSDFAQDLETDSGIYKTLLESTQAIPWKIDWGANRMHPEDRAWVVDFCIAQSQAGTDHEADYRALTKAGDYVWIRDVVHVIRNAAGEVEALVGFMFDISERKKTEQKLLDLQKELEALSYKDGLTGVANRRMFDSIMEME